MMTERPNWVGNTHSCRRWPAWPNGASNVKPSPVPKPSREIEKLWTRTWDMAASEALVVCDINWLTLTPSEAPPALPLSAVHRHIPGVRGTPYRPIVQVIDFWSTVINEHRHRRRWHRRADGCHRSATTRALGASHRTGIGARRSWRGSLTLAQCTCRTGSPWPRRARPVPGPVGR